MKRESVVIVKRGMKDEFEIVAALTGTRICYESDPQRGIERAGRMGARCIAFEGYDFEESLVYAGAAAHLLPKAARLVLPDAACSRVERLALLTFAHGCLDPSRSGDFQWITCLGVAERVKWNQAERWMGAVSNLLH
jgi:hypothetical protein